MQPTRFIKVGRAWWYAVIANNAFWKKLPIAVRVRLQLAMLDATISANLYAEQENREALEKVRASGKSEVLTLSPDEKELWRTKWMPVHREMEQRVGKDLLHSIHREAALNGYQF